MLMLSGPLTLCKARTLSNLAIDTIERHDSGRINGSLSLKVARCGTEEVEKCCGKGREMQIETRNGVCLLVS